MSVPVIVQVQWERFYIKLYNSFIHVSVPVPETASVIKLFENMIISYRNVDIKKKLE